MKYKLPMRFVDRARVGLLALLVRAGVGLGPHSGQGTPPLFGDFEAQRHWMETTAALPLREWYSYDLPYWGLDYPPLTAYHSWALGELAKRAAPGAVAFETSRGSESPETKTWMRFACLLSDALSFLPAVLVASAADDASSWLTLLSPALVLIDHGHFQFNCVAHGFVVLAVRLLLEGEGISLARAFLASAAFCAALNFKQMTLYYSPILFFYLLSWAVFPLTHGAAAGGAIATSAVRMRARAKCESDAKKKSQRLTTLGVAVIGTFALLWGPFIWQGQAMQVLARVFPFERGLFEDKVANFWCTTNVLIKWKTMDRKFLTALSLFATALSIVPACTCVLVRGDKDRVGFLYGLFNCSLSFFLFSFQVHEKSILLATVPAVLLFAHDFLLGFWFSVFATLSMVPLFIKDQIVVTAYLLLAFFALLALPEKPAGKRNVRALEASFLALALVLGGTTWLMLFVRPPARWPDLFVVAHEAVAFVALALFYCYGNVVQLLPGWRQDSAMKTKRE